MTLRDLRKLSNNDEEQDVAVYYIGVSGSRLGLGSLSTAVSR